VGARFINRQKVRKRFLGKFPDKIPEDMGGWGQKRVVTGDAFILGKFKLHVCSPDVVDN
jgi:hypothetical protein